MFSRTETMYSVMEHRGYCLVYKFIVFIFFLWLGGRKSSKSKFIKKYPKAFKTVCHLETCFATWSLSSKGESDGLLLSQMSIPAVEGFVVET